MKYLLSVLGAALLFNFALADGDQFIWCKAVDREGDQSYYSGVFEGYYGRDLTYRLAFKDYVRNRYMADEDRITRLNLDAYCSFENSAGEARAARERNAADILSPTRDYKKVFTDWTY